MQPLPPLEHGARLGMTELCQRLDCGETKVRGLIANEGFPPPWFIGKTPYWWEADVIAYEWLASRGAFAHPPVEWEDESESARNAPRRAKGPQTPPNPT